MHTWELEVMKRKCTPLAIRGSGNVWKGIGVSG